MVPWSENFAASAILFAGTTISAVLVVGMDGFSQTEKRCIVGDCVDGLGLATWSDGIEYAGEFKRGLAHGLGCYHWRDGSMHAGKVTHTCIVHALSVRFISTIKAAEMDLACTVGRTGRVTLETIRTAKKMDSVHSCSNRKPIWYVLVAC